MNGLMTCVFAVYCTLILWRLASGDRAKRLSLACFGLSMTLLYAASGTYHALALPPDSPARLFFRRLDHSAIYGLIVTVVGGGGAIGLYALCARSLRVAEFGFLMKTMAARFGGQSGRH